MRFLASVVSFLIAASASTVPATTVQPGPDSTPGRVAVLMYHHLAEPSERPEQPGVITPERFDSHLQMLRSEGYNLVTAEAFAAFLDGEQNLPDHSVLLTFDDGYESNYRYGFPLLQKYQAPAIIFPVMKYFAASGKGAPIPHLTLAQAREMHASGLVTFGAHTYDGHAMVPTGPEGLYRGPWLNTRAWRADEGRVETEEEYRTRVRADLEWSARTLRELGVKGEGLQFALPYGVGDETVTELLHATGFRYIYSIDDSQVNRLGQAAPVYRIDAGHPEMSPDKLQQRLQEALGGPVPKP